MKDVDGVADLRKDGKIERGGDDLLAHSGGGEQLAAALAMPIGLLDINDICVYGPPDIVNAAFLEATQRRVDMVSSSKFHKHTSVRRCQVGSDIALRGSAIDVVHHYIENGH